MTPISDSTIIDKDVVAKNKRGTPSINEATPLGEGGEFKGNKNRRNVEQI